MDTQAFDMKPQGASLVVLENDEVRVFRLDQRAEWSIGRINDEYTPDIPFDSSIVSRRHGWLRCIDDYWYYVEEKDNLNGTIHNGKKLQKPVNGSKHPVMLDEGDVLRIDNEDLNHISAQGVMMFFTMLEPFGTWVVQKLSQSEAITIGRDEKNTIPDARPFVSSKHAKIVSINNSFFISDCKSRAGTFVNGKPVTAATKLREKDSIVICGKPYFFLGSSLLYCREDAKFETMHAQQPPVLKAEIEAKLVKNNNGKGQKELLHDIQLEVKKGTLVALLGTSGAGKSTLMNCFNGMDLSGVRGKMNYRGIDMIGGYDQIKSLIGSVPQEKIIHDTFTPEQELTIAAQKRLPPDTTKAEIKNRVDQTLDMLGINAVRKTRNSKLSGGEKARVNIGIELVADRELYCMDEPDAGLSPDKKHELVQIMRNLSHQHHKTVITIIHDVADIDMFDQVIMLAKANGVGRLAFSGTPAEARSRFDVSELSAAYDMLQKNPEKYV